MFSKSRRCPYCGQKIKQQAIKCRYCGAFSESEMDARACVWCRVMIGISLALLLVWLMVFMSISGAG